MKTNVLVILLVLVLIIGGILGFLIGKKYDKPIISEIKVGSETTYVNIVKYDTIVNYKYRDQIRVVNKIDTIKIIDTISNTIVSKEDSTICYSFNEKEKDGAYISVDVCSDSLPRQKPLDLMASIKYQAPPDTSKTIFRVDTITFTKEKPIFKDWKFYLMTTLGVIGGVYVGAKISR